jgi:hypothetical protein
MEVMDRITMASQNLCGDQSIAPHWKLISCLDLGVDRAIKLDQGQLLTMTGTAETSNFRIAPRVNENMSRPPQEKSTWPIRRLESL